MNNPNLTNLAVTPPSPTIFRTSQPTGDIATTTKQSPVSRKGDFDIKPTTTALIGATPPNVAPQDATKIAKGYAPQIDKLGVAKKSISAKAQSYSKQDAKSAVRDTASLLLGNNNAVAGILGNVDKESKFNSGAINPNDAGQGKDSFGLFQHNKDRLANLKAYADKQGKSYNNPELQTEFALQEAKQIKVRKSDIPYYSKFNEEYSPLIDRYKGMSLYDALRDPYITKEEAATLWVGYFERPANLSNEAKVRSANAAKFYAGGDLPNSVDAKDANGNTYKKSGSYYINNNNKKTYVYHPISKKFIPVDVKLHNQLESLPNNTNSDKFYDNAALAYIAKKNNVDDITDKENTTLIEKTLTKNRPHYNPITGKLVIRTSDDLLDEIPHKIQANKGTFSLFKQVKEVIQNGAEETYDIEGTLEHDAHSVIQPKIEEEFNMLTNKPKKKFYNGGSLKKKKYDIGGLISLATAASGTIGNTMDLFNGQENPDVVMSAISGMYKNPILAPLGAIQGGVQAYRQKQAYGIKLDKLGLGNFNQGKESYANALAGMSTARGFYAKGGETNTYDYEVEDKEVIQGEGVELEGGKGKELSSDMTVVDGELHEEGGVQGSGGERVFSDRIKPSPSLTKVITKLGFKVKEDDTYATLATKFGKLKGEMEDKNKNATGHIARNTASSMLPKLNMLIEATYQDQEATKEGVGNTARIFAMGGKLPKYPLGGGLTSYGNSMNIPMTLGTKLPFPTFNGQVGLGNPTQGIKGVGIASSPNSVAGQMDLGDLGALAGGQGGGKQDLSTLTPALLSGFGYLNEMIANSRLRMPNSPNLLSLLPNTYTDRTQAARNRNEASARSMMSQVSRNNIGERQAMFSRLLNANNDLQQSENQRRDTYEQNLTAQNAGVKAQNVQAVNVYNQDYTDAQNQKVVNAQKAGNAFTTNMTTAIRENNAKNLDLAKMGLIMDSRMIGREGMKMSIAERTKRLKDAGMSDAQIVKLLGDNSTN
jgi:hypothetical protein